MEKDYTVFNIPHADKLEPAVVFVEKEEAKVENIIEEKLEVRPEPEVKDIFEEIYDSNTDEVCDFYDELNRIAEELEECRLRNC